MRWSQAFIPTLRDDPADSEAVSHKLLVRAGYIRHLLAGVYSILPLVPRASTKVSHITRAGTHLIGGRLSERGATELRGKQQQRIIQQSTLSQIFQ